MTRTAGLALRCGMAMGLAALLSGCWINAPDADSPEGGASIDDFYGQAVEWDECTSEAELEERRDTELADLAEWDFSGGELAEFESEVELDHEHRLALECGAVTVPIDYDTPDGRTMEIALARQPATGSDEDRVGSLLLNPGGPGESGVEMLDYPQLSERVGEHFDLVGFDPRGVGERRAIECGDPDAWEELPAEADPADLSDEEFEELGAAIQADAEDCIDTYSEEFLTSVSADNVARDMDVMRDALGDDQLTYVGYSYGTHLGVHYAEQFPDKVRAMVLDGATETTRNNAEIAVDQAAGFQHAWEEFAAYCSGESGCPLSGPDSADAEMDELLDRIESAGYEVLGEDVTREFALDLFADALYSEEAWEGLYWTLEAVDYGDHAIVQGNLEIDAENMFGSDWEELESGEDEGVGAYAAMTVIDCADREDPTDLEAYREAAAEAAEASPLFGASLVWGHLHCAYLPAGDPPPTDATAADAPPLVVVGTRGDPATPYHWAEELAGQLESAVLVTYEGDGHTIYGYGSNSCIDDPLDDYLIEATPPGNGLTCPKEG